MSQIKVSYKRHLAKTLSYRLISTTVGFLGMWWASGSIKIGAAFGVVELIYKPLQYYVHERVWYRYIRFGLVEEKKKTKSKVSSNDNTSEVADVSETTTRKKKVLNYGSNR